MKKLIFAIGLLLLFGAQDSFAQWVPEYIHTFNFNQNPGSEGPKLNLDQKENKTGTFSFRENTSGSVTQFHNMTNWSSTQYTQGHLWNKSPAQNKFVQNFRFLFPVDYDSAYEPGYPLIIMLHGAGERGNCWGNNCHWSNPNWDPTKDPGPNPPPGTENQSRLLNNDHNLLHGGNQHLQAVNRAGNKKPNDPTLPPRDFAGFVLFPQNLNGWSGTELLETTRMVHLLLNEYNIDRNRVVIHGLSNGAQHVITFVKQDPALFAGMLLMSPSASNTKIRGDSALSHIPLWVFQGGNDGNPTQSQTETLIRWFEELGGQARYTLYPNLGHGTWNSAFNEPDFFTWIKERDKADIHVYFGEPSLCATNENPVKLGVSYGFSEYQWEKDGGIVSGALNHELFANSPGTYRVRFRRHSMDWNKWSKPVVVGESAAVTPQILASGSSHFPDRNGNSTVTFSTQPNPSVNFDFLHNDNKIGHDSINYVTIQNAVAGNAGEYNLITRTFSDCPSLPSASFYLTVNAPTTIPIPTEISATETSEGTIRLFWNDNGPDELGYEVWRSESGSVPYTFLGLTGEDGVTFHDTTAVSDRTYYYQIRAVGKTATSPYTSNLAISTGTDIIPPSAPQNLVSTGFTLNSVDLAWTAATDNIGIEQYYVYYGSDSVATGTNTPSFTVSNLQEGKTFVFTVRAVDYSGNLSLASNQISVATVFEGLAYEHSTGAWESLDEITPEQWNSPEFTGHVPNFTIDPKTQDDFFNFKFDGYIYIEEGQAGFYEFRAQSDDGSRIYINGFDPGNTTSNLVYDHDGLHGCNFSSTIIPKDLEVGAHPITLVYFERTGGECLSVYFRKDGGDWTEIPDAMLRSGNPENFTPPPAPTNLQASSAGMTSIDLTWDQTTGYPDDLKIVVLGSSTAEGIGASAPANAWVGRLNTWLGGLGINYTLHNLGTGGITTDRLLPTGSSSGHNPSHAPNPDINITKALSLNPRIIIVNMPSNNVHEDIPIATTMAHYQEIKALADAAGIKIFFTTTQPRNFGTDSGKRHFLQDEANAVRGSYGKFVIDIYDELTNFSNDLRIKVEYNSGDGIHLNDAGHGYIFSEVQAKLQEFLLGFEGYRSLSGAGPFEFFGRIEGNVNAFTDTGLLPGTTYYYKLKAVNLNGTSDFSGTASATTLGDTEAPGIPQNVEVVTHTFTNAGFKWTASADNVGVTGYTIYANGDSIGTSSNNTFYTNVLEPDITYSITVTAFDASGNESGHSDPVIFDTGVPDIFYSKSSGNLDDLSTWGKNTDGSGETPADFTHNGQYFMVTNGHAINLSSNWTIGGSTSRVIIDVGETLTVGSILDGRISIKDNGFFEVNTIQSSRFGQLSTTSTVEFNEYNSVPVAQYGNLILKSDGVKNLEQGDILVKGDLTISSAITLKGAPGNTTRLILEGDVDIQEESGDAAIDNRVGLRFAGNGIQTMSTGGNLSLYDIVTIENSLVVLNHTGSGTITVGSPNGGGLRLSNNSSLDIGHQTLLVRDLGSINPGGTTGKISMENGSLLFNSQGATASHLYFDEAKNIIHDLRIEGPAELNIKSAINITEGVKLIGGTLHSDGHITLKSNDQTTAGIFEIENGGVINGSVHAERYMDPKGRIYRYIASPVQGMTVAGWQDYFPITGNFNGTSKGPGLTDNPSLFYYKDEEWRPYPPPGGSNQAPIELGIGYAAFIREADDTMVVNTGVPHQGNFTFDLSPGTTSDQDGWTLLGNPYAATIEWKTQGWTSSGISNIIAVTNNPGTVHLYSDTDGMGSLTGGKIASAQSFWVQAVTGSPSLVITESAKAAGDSATSSTFFRMAGDEAPVLDYYFSVKLKNLSSGIEDPLFVKFTPAGEDNYNGIIDGAKRKNEVINFSSLSDDGVNLAINHMSDEFCDKIINLSIEDISTGNYSISFGNLEHFALGQILLEDAFLEETTEIGLSTTYSFTIDEESPATFTDRFSLQITRLELNTNISLETNPMICEGQDTEVTLMNSQAGVLYQLKDLDGNSITEPIYGNGNDLIVGISQEFLGLGEQIFKITAGYPGCSNMELEEEIEILVDPFPVVTVPNNTVFGCDDEDIVLTASGAGTNGSYEWFEGSESWQIENEDGATLTISDIYENYGVYYVRAVSASGCQSSNLEMIEVQTVALEEPILNEEEENLQVFTVDEADIQWFLNDNPIDGATASSITMDEPGIYYAAVNYFGCVKYTESIHYRITGLDGLSDHENIFMTVYPNPVYNGEITIKGNSRSHNDLNIEIMDLLGKVRISHQISLQDYQNGFKIGLDKDLSTGMYVIVLEQEGEVLQQKLLIK